MFAALFIPALVGALAGAMASFIGRAILALGVGVVTYTGLSVALDVVKANVVSATNALPTQAFNLLGYLWFDKALTLIFSAVAASLAMRLIGGSLKKMVIK